MGRPFVENRDRYLLIKPTSRRFTHLIGPFEDEAEIEDFQKNYLHSAWTATQPGTVILRVGELDLDESLELHQVDKSRVYKPQSVFR